MKGLIQGLVRPALWMQRHINEVNDKRENAWDVGTGEIVKGFKALGSGTECDDEGFHRQYAGKGWGSAEWKRKGLKATDSILWSE